MKFLNFSKFVFLKALIPSNPVPTTITNGTTINGDTFLLLNNEFKNDTYLLGFELYGTLNGTIKIQVIISKMLKYFQIHSGKISL